MVSRVLSLLAFAGFGYASRTACKCTPEDSCWPSVDSWNALNTTVAGKLIHNLPVAISCYPGTYQNAEECAHVYSQWSNSTFQELSPVGYVYPTDVLCPAVDPSTGESPGKCILGPAPVYTINATEPAELAAGIDFAQKNNVRLVIRNTGHDMLGKSEGYGALQIWVKYIQTGINFHETYTASDKCASSKWTGSAITIGGGYVWEDVYDLAFKRNVVIVGGGDPTVGCIGGYTQGGGHSPASHDYGLAADQVLEAQVVLASGSIVTANACQNSDLYFAIRGGGGGSYGVVTSMTVKVYPSKPVVAQSLTISPIEASKDTNSLLDAITDVHEHYPSIMDAGFAGYGSWSVNSPMKLFANETVGYVHAAAIMGKSLIEAQKISQPLLKSLQKYNGTSLSVSVAWFEFPTYAAYYQAMSGVKQPVGSSNSAMTSRMIGKTALTSSRTQLRSMIEVIAGEENEYTINNVELVGGGKVLTDGNDQHSGVNPAWRSTYIVEVVARGWADESAAQSVKDDITNNKGKAMSQLTPHLGSYMSEADRNDPLWADNFYGTNYERLAAIKQKYDPTGLFYCPTCVGSPSWSQQYLPGTHYGPLCSTGV
ncbi:FAD-binding type 2 [Penicillium coprophilum]|uniref:FAD-binding type 2 n=1 Tax=Penicillium coprophilum TaxID=36646 RepID=UPI0023A0B69F|nr:FAD-binding type 2 [Penicillium coprophilum]KAJ5177651.1 FAD-binding type 2 [Penicillium coprophilum]